MEVSKRLMYTFIFVIVFFCAIISPAQRVQADHNNGTAPFLEYEIDHLYVPTNGELTIDLDRYFNDAEDQVLIYSVNKSKVKNLDITFSKSYMTIKLGENFSEFEKFNILVNDGDDDTGDHDIISDFVYVFEDKTQEEETVNETTNESTQENNSSNQEHNESNSNITEEINASDIGQETKDVGNENSSVIDDTSSEDKPSLFILLAILGAISLVVIILLVILFKK